MSIIHSVSTIIGARAPGGSAFSPTRYGRNSNVVVGDDDHYNIGGPGPNASCDVAMWVIQTSSNCYIRVGINDDPNQINTWYNTSSVSMGDPGNTSATGATIYELGEQCDTVKIDYTNTTVTGSPTFTNPPSGGTFTDNVAFSPTTDVKYGVEIQVLDTSDPGPIAEHGSSSIDFTFAKSGYETDATVTFSMYAKARSQWEP